MRMVLLEAALLTICGRLHGRDAKLGRLQHVDVMPDQVTAAAAAAVWW